MKNTLKGAIKLGEGIQGVCYELPSGMIYKEFKEPKPKSEMERYEEFKDLETSSIIFPDKLVYGLRYFKGHISKKAIGDKLNESYMDVNLVDLTKSLVKLDDDIEFLSSRSIQMRDIHSGNVIFDGTNLSVIDIDSYYHSFSTTDFIRDKNYKYTTQMLLDVISTALGGTKYYKEAYHYLKNLLMYDVNASEYLRLALIELNKFIDEECTTLAEYQRVYKKR